MGRRIWIGAGELSGDMQAGAVLAAMRSLEPDLTAVGMGGPHLASAGQKNLFDISLLSAMGGAEIISVIPRAMMLLSRIRRALMELRPDAVVLVDCPDFHFRVAKIAAGLNIPVYYFIPPKVWAWRTGRVRFLRRYCRRIFSILPFEEDFYRQHGLAVEYIGNPIVDRIHESASAAALSDADLIGLLPGSRRKEVSALMPVFCEAALQLRKRFPELRFSCLRASTIDKAMLEQYVPEELDLEIVEGGAPYAFMRRCSSIMAASGTATLETALCGVPTVVAYKLSRISECIIRRLIKVDFVSLPNLIAGHEVFPECLQADCEAGNIARHITRWREDAAVLEQVRAGLADIAGRCGPPGAARRCAENMLSSMKEDCA